MSLLKHLISLLIFSQIVLAEDLKHNNPLKLYFDSDTPLVTVAGKPTPSAEYILSSVDFLEQHNLPYQIIRLPWTRIQRDRELESNVLVQELIRTKQREADYYWLHRLRSIDYYLFSLSNFAESDLTPDKIKQGNYSAVCEQGSAQCRMLMQSGLSDDQVIRVQDAKEGRLAGMLTAGRADLILTSKVRMDIYARDSGNNMNDFKPVMHVQKIHVYLAAKKSSLTPDYEVILSRLNLSHPDSTLKN